MDIARQSKLLHTWRLYTALTIGKYFIPLIMLCPDTEDCPDIEDVHIRDSMHCCEPHQSISHCWLFYAVAIFTLYLFGRKHFFMLYWAVDQLWVSCLGGRMLRHSSKRFASVLFQRQNAGAVVNASQCRGLKQDTGIVGVPVDPDARSNLRWDKS